MSAKVRKAESAKVNSAALLIARAALPRRTCFSTQHSALSTQNFHSTPKIGSTGSVATPRGDSSSAGS
jgi:hypothetical protein